MAPEPLPTFVYKITPESPPPTIPAEYPLSELDQTDGFVHLSVSTQIPITAGLFFQDVSTLWVIKLRLAGFASSTTWEVEGCPHLYGNFGIADWESSQKFEREEGQKWEQVFGASSWLE